MKKQLKTRTLGIRVDEELYWDLRNTNLDVARICRRALRKALTELDVKVPTQHTRKGR